MPLQAYALHDEAETISFGAALANAFLPGLVVYLQGDLGAGKTTLTRAVLHAMGHSGRVKSPTYSLVEPYDITLNGVQTPVYHFDLYRMNEPEEFLEAGFREHFDGESICLVEWPEKGDAVLPAPDMLLVLTVLGDGRNIDVHGLSDKGQTCLQQLTFESAYE